MTKNLDKNVDVRAKRNEYIWQLEQLAAKMEKNELNKSVTLDGPQNGNKQIHLAQHRIQAGKIIFDAYQSGEFHGDGTLCKILDHWSKSPGSEFADWRYIQGFESICWEWYGSRFEKCKKELGELRAYAYVIRLLVSELEKENID